MPLDDYIDGPPCPRGCNVPTHRVHRVHSNMQGPPYHDCPLAPWRLLPALVAKHERGLRKEYGDAVFEELREWADR